MRPRQLVPLGGCATLLGALLLLGCVEPNPHFAPDPVLAPAGPSFEPGAAVVGPATPAASSPDAGAPAEDGPPVATPPAAPAGGKLCDPCDPYHPEQCADPEGMCVVNIDTHESFCTTACDNKTPCPSGYKCIAVTTLDGKDAATQCVPLKLRCTN